MCRSITARLSAYLWIASGLRTRLAILEGRYGRMRARGLWAASLLFSALPVGCPVPGIESSAPNVLYDLLEKRSWVPRDASEFMSRHCSFTSLVSAHHHFCRRRSFLSSLSFCLSPHHLNDNCSENRIGVLLSCPRPGRPLPCPRFSYRGVATALQSMVGSHFV